MVRQVTDPSIISVAQLEFFNDKLSPPSKAGDKFLVLALQYSIVVNSLPSLE